jgi:hypothetical protein
MSKRVEDLRILVNKKMKLDKYLSICEGLHYACFFMVIFYVVTFKNGDTPYLISWAFLALIGWVASTILEKKIVQVKLEMTSELFESKSQE